MQWVGLLRGINIGGRNKVDMKRLTSAAEQAGFKNVSTYINSGNIFFTSPEPAAVIVQRLEAVIKTKFKLEIKVLLGDRDNINQLVAAVPSAWENGQEMKCDVMFLWEKYDDEQVMSHLTISPGVDDVRYVDGALIWKVDRAKAMRSGMMKLPGTDLYANMTVRNCNTVRQIQARLS